eukprot:7350315-Karenia_brevis.AAC.1
MKNTYLARAPAVITGFAHLLSHTNIAIVQEVAGITWLELFLVSLACLPNPTQVIQSGDATNAKHIFHLLREFASNAA